MKPDVGHPHLKNHSAPEVSWEVGTGEFFSLWAGYPGISHGGGGGEQVKSCLKGSGEVRPNTEVVL